ncbi:hypothetical protein AK812_SmicGene48589, partial [Symbiodinium microadriaticum]
MQARCAPSILPLAIAEYPLRLRVACRCHILS